MKDEGHGNKELEEGSNGLMVEIGWGQDLSDFGYNTIGGEGE